MSRIQQCRDVASLAFCQITVRQRNHLAMLALRIVAADGGGDLLDEDYLTEALEVFRELAPTMGHELTELVTAAQPIVEITRRGMTP